MFFSKTSLACIVLYALGASQLVLSTTPMEGAPSTTIACLSPQCDSLSPLNSSFRSL
ncbi:hypothetical protein PGT21_013194 [Puccinia graminis f. sp. tritici]|uniref:Uncharacterized protein n=1 Tax=Puccinia graminis f. sp. tritici TaxID=56615 RepID=A0A5B0M8G9_PUCGR|nr:hypothetical protein PGT21_013194 [Puccinia graminis f. sp. tritici]